MQIKGSAYQDSYTILTIATANPVMTRAVIRTPYTDTGIVDRARRAQIDIDIQSQFATFRHTLRRSNRCVTDDRIIQPIKPTMTEPIGLSTVHLQRRWYKYIIFTLDRSSTQTTPTVSTLCSSSYTVIRRRRPAHPVSVFILHLTDIRTLWSKQFDIEILHCNPLNRKNNATSCHRTHTSNLRALNER